MKSKSSGMEPVRNTSPGQGRMLTVKKRGEPQMIPVREVLYAESFGRKVMLHFTGGQVEYYERIGNLERALGARFFRVHRSFLVNMDMIDRFTRTEVLLRGGSTAWISKYKYADFVRAYETRRREKIA